MENDIKAKLFDMMADNNEIREAIKESGNSDLIEKVNEICDKQNTSIMSLSSYIVSEKAVEKEEFVQEEEKEEVQMEENSVSQEESEEVQAEEEITIDDSKVVEPVSEEEPVMEESAEVPTEPVVEPQEEVVAETPSEPVQEEASLPEPKVTEEASSEAVTVQEQSDDVILPPIEEAAPTVAEATPEATAENAPTPSIPEVPQAEQPATPQIEPQAEVQAEAQPTQTDGLLLSHVDTGVAEARPIVLNENQVQNTMATAPASTAVVDSMPNMVADNVAAPQPEVAPVSPVAPTAEEAVESMSPEEIMNKIQSMLEQANEMYKNGNEDEAQHLYDQISQLNKLNAAQNTESQEEPQMKMAV